MITPIKTTAKIMSVIKSDRLPLIYTINLNICGESEIGAVIMRHSCIHHFGNVGQMSCIFNQIGVTFRTIPLCPTFCKSVPYGDIALRSCLLWR